MQCSSLILTPYTFKSLQDKTSFLDGWKSELLSQKQIISLISEKNVITRQTSLMQLHAHIQTAQFSICIKKIWYSKIHTKEIMLHEYKYNKKGRTKNGSAKRPGNSIISSAWSNYTYSTILSYWLIVCWYKMSANRRVGLVWRCTRNYTINRPLYWKHFTNLCWHICDNLLYICFPLLLPQVYMLETK